MRRTRRSQSIRVGKRKCTRKSRVSSWPPARRCVLRTGAARKVGPPHRAVASPVQELASPDSPLWEATLYSKKSQTRSGCAPETQAEPAANGDCSRSPCPEQDRSSPRGFLRHNVAPLALPAIARRRNLCDARIDARGYHSATRRRRGSTLLSGRRPIVNPPFHANAIDALRSIRTTARRIGACRVRR